MKIPRPGSPRGFQADLDRHDYSLGGTTPRSPIHGTAILHPGPLGLKDKVKLRRQIPSIEENVGAASAAMASFCATKRTILPRSNPASSLNATLQPFAAPSRMALLAWWDARPSARANPARRRCLRAARAIRHPARIHHSSFYIHHSTFIILHSSVPALHSPSA